MNRLKQELFSKKLFLTTLTKQETLKPLEQALGLALPSIRGLHDQNFILRLTLEEKGLRLECKIDYSRFINVVN